MSRIYYFCDKLNCEINMANDNLNKSKRETFIEKYRSHRPELPEDDEEAMYGALSEDFDEYDRQMSDLRASNDKYKKDQDDFLKAIASNPDNARYIEGMMNGEDWLSTSIAIHGYDGLIDYLSSEEAREKYKEADAKHKAQLAKSEELDKESAANAEKTDADIAAAIESGRFTREQYEEALGELFDITDGLELNVCKPEWIEMVIAAKNHDTDMEKAREEGRKSGRNEGLEANLAKRRKSSAPAGGPQMPVNMGGRTSGEKQKRGSSIADLLNIS